MKNFRRLLDMNTNQIYLKTVACYALHSSLIDNHSLPSCINCDWWDNSNNKCNKFNSTPPAEIIVKSCGADNWVPMIPF